MPREANHGPRPHGETVKLNSISISDPSRRMRYLVLRIDWSTVYFLPQANIRSNPANQSVALRIYAEGSEDKWCTSTTPINAEHQKIGTRYNPRAQPYSPVPCDHSALTFDIGHCVIMGESMSEVNAPFFSASRMYYELGTTPLRTESPSSSTLTTRCAGLKRIGRSNHNGLQRPRRS